MTAVKGLFKVPANAMLIALSALAAGTTAEKQDWIPPQCPSDPKVLAEELIRLEFSGRGLADRTPCIDQAKFKYVVAWNEGPSEKPGKPDVILNDEDSFSIDKLSRKDDIGTYVAEFTIHKSSGGKMREKQSLRDSITYVVHETRAKQELKGCATLLTPPDKIYVYRRCLKPASGR